MRIPTLTHWPLPALLAWLLAWGVFIALARAGLPAPWPLLAGVGVCVLAWRWAQGAWRRALVLGGFLASALLTSGAALGGWNWAWLAALALLLALYPLRSWRDAPLYPTPRGALDALASAAPLPPGARVLDAGCGAGDGLLALARVYPQAELHGTEWSAPVALLARWRCRGLAQVRRGDMWADDWTGFALVYLFQRPESMPRAWAKAQAEMAAGAWLVSLEFAVPNAAAQAELATPAGKPVWVYRIGVKTPS